VVYIRRYDYTNKKYKLEPVKIFGINWAILLLLLGNFPPTLLRIGEQSRGPQLQARQVSVRKGEKTTSINIFVLLLDGQPPLLRKSKSYSER